MAAAVGLAMVASGCSGGSSGRRPAPEGVLRVGLERPQTLDPAYARFPADHLVVDQLFDGLTTYDPATLSIHPALATRWETSPDQKTWTFFLRPGARFSNGRAIDSSDVRYTMERIAANGSGSPASAQLEAVAGFKAFNDGKADTLAGLTTPSAGTVKFELAYSLSSFPAVLGSPSFGIVPREAVEAQPPAPNFAEQPVGSGPFMLRSRSIDVLRLMPAPGAPTALSGLEVYMGQDGDAPYAAFLRGQLDWTAVPAERVDEVVRNRGRTGFQPYPAQLFYGFNLRNPKYRDARFREAIVRAINRDTIIKVVYGSRVRPTSGIVADGIPGHQEDPCAEKCRFDPAGAKALLAEIFGSRPVPEVNIDYDDDPTQAAVAQSMQADLSAVGITANLRAHSYTDYLKFAVSGQQELFRLAWIGAYPNPDAFLVPLFYTGQPDNVTGFSSEEFDALIRAAREEPDQAKSLAAYQNAEKIVMSELPVVPIAQYETHTLVSSRVRNLAMTAFGTFDASRVQLR
ncbi:MAG: ABC transporter substrate-binding protein [Actinomycetota bacterium]|nr:ABC transporter substrate-binding protein [Actinomycetota bacterium]